MKKIAHITASVVLFFMPFIMMSDAWAAPDTCTWDGSADSNWSNGANWTGCDNGGVPENGDSLIFGTAGLAQQTTNNDIVGLSVVTITFNDGNYEIGGNSLAFSGTNPISASNSALFTADLTFAAASVNLTTSGGDLQFDGLVDITTPGDFTVNGGDNVTFNGNVSGSIGGNLYAQTNSIVSFAGLANTYTATNVGIESDATFACDSDACFGDSGNNIYVGDGTVLLRASGTFGNTISTVTAGAYDPVLEAQENITISGNVSVDNSLTIRQSGAGTKSLQFLGDMSLGNYVTVYGNNSNQSTVRFNGAVSGVGGIAPNDVFLELTANNTFDGQVTINDGAVVSAESANALGSTVEATSVIDGGQLLLDMAGATTIPEVINIQGTGQSNSGALRNIGVSPTISGDFIFSANARVVGINGNTVTFSGSIGCSPGAEATLTSEVAEGANFIMSGSTANTCDGNVVVDGVYLGLMKNANVNAIEGDITVIGRSFGHGQVEVGNNGLISDSSDIMLSPTANGAYFILANGVDETVGSVTGSGSIKIANDTNLTLASNADYTFSGDIERTQNTTADPSVLTHAGSGVLTLSGTITDSGAGYPEIVNTNGTILFDAADSSFENVTNSIIGGTLKGNGIIGPTSLTSSTAAPGNSPGCINPSGNFSFSSNSTYQVEINGLTACTDYDKIDATGTVALADATLDIQMGYTPSDGEVFTIVEAASVTGTFNGLSNGETIVVSGITFRIKYTSNAVTLTYLGSVSVNAPNTGYKRQNIYFAGVLILLGLALLYASRRYGKQTV